LCRPYIGGGTTRLPSTSSAKCIGSAQHATDLGAPSIPLGRRAMPIRLLQQATDPFMPDYFPGRQWVYYERGSAKIVSSKTLARCDETPVYLIFVETGDILTALTLPIRLLQQATDPFMPDYFAGRQWVFYGRGSAKSVSPKTLPCCDKSPVYPIFRDNRRHSYRFDPASSSSAASHRCFHAQFLSGPAVGILWKRIR
jgi:hypothetical protein